LSSNVDRTAEEATVESICATCGVESEAAQKVCPICADERQYVSVGGQRWTTLHELASSVYELEVRELEPGLFGVHRAPEFAIGQWSMLLQTPKGNLLWDPPSFLDDRVAGRVQRLGGVAVIAASHPHMFGAQVSWSYAFDSAPIWVNAADERWLQRRDPVIKTWSGTQEVLPGVRLVQCGGHFPGSAVAHWREGASGSGVLLTGDTIADVAATGWVTFLRSYVNRIPLSAAVIERIVATLEPYDYQRLYTLNGGGLEHDAKKAVRRSADRYIGWVRGDFDADT
jgi:glyoxylase-like metal-dependent hydrolase (beta-lactamase superfamily II)